MILLEKEPSRTVELGENLDYPPHYVWKYLNNLRNYGLVREQDYSWFLTDLGSSFILKFLNKYTIIETRKTLEREAKETRKLESRSVVRQVSIAAWTRINEFSSSEQKVVEVMLAHYNETGSPFLYFRDHWMFAEKFTINPDDVNDVIMRLKQDKIIYVFNDRSMNAQKINLKKDYIAGLIANSKVP